MKLDPRDPFGEHSAPSSSARVSVLGADILIESTDTALTRLAVEAYGGLPRFEPDRPAIELTVSIVSSEHGQTWPKGAPPPAPALSSGGGLLCATVDAGNFVIVDPANKRALISVSRAMLLHPYIVRYEMIEFAVLTLASRSQSLVPLHAACVGLGGNGCLIIGASGTGKSTLCLMALDDDMLVLAEDSAFLDPVSFSIFGVPNYLHAKYEAPNLLAHGRLSDFVSAAPVIRRRSGTLKFEADLRRLGRGIPQSSLRLNATIFLTQQRADIDSVMKPVDRADMIARMNEEQPYAAGLAGWDQVCEKLAEHPCFELQRTDPPAAAVRELRALLA